MKQTAVEHAPELRLRRRDLIRPSASICFIDAVALGIVTPLLYHILVLPDSLWIAGLFAVDGIGRICGWPVRRVLAKMLVDRKTRLCSATLAALGYSLLIVVGWLRPAESTAFALIYAWRFLAAMAASDLPVVRLIGPTGGRHVFANGLLAHMGFAAGAC